MKVPFFSTQAHHLEYRRPKKKNPHEGGFSSGQS
jgi:hypothetical protein